MRTLSNAAFLPIAGLVLLTTPPARAEGPPTAPPITCADGAYTDLPWARVDPPSRSRAPYAPPRTLDPGCLGITTDGRAAAFRTLPDEDGAWSGYAVARVMGAFIVKANWGCLAPHRWRSGGCRDSRGAFERSLQACRPDPDRLLIDGEGFAWGTDGNALWIEVAGARWVVHRDDTPILSVHQLERGGGIFVEAAPLPPDSDLPERAGVSTEAIPRSQRDTFPPDARPRRVKALYCWRSDARGPWR